VGRTGLPRCGAVPVELSGHSFLCQHTDAEVVYGSSPLVELRPEGDGARDVFPLLNRLGMSDSS
jgi:hypothetical protein